MKSFFKMVLASMVGFLLASVLFSMLTIIMLAAVIAMAPGEDYRVPSSSVLHIKLDVPIQDRGLKSPFEPVLGMQSLGLNQILKAMDRAATDDRIKGIYLDMGMLQGGMGTLEELREGLLKFAESGKPVIAYGEVVGQRSYYLATAADEIYLHPVGILDFSGLSAQLAFVKGLSEKMKVDMQVIRPTNNTYKSAVEPFLMDRMSEANREQTMRYLSSGWDHMLNGVSTSRGITSDQLNLIADSLSTFMPDGALRLGLVDGLLFYDQLTDTLIGRMGLPAGEKIELVTIGKYIRVLEKTDASLKVKGKPDEQIAIIYASGNIVMGEGEDMVISSGHMSDAIRKARKDEGIKAIVLRVNSGGGDGIASEIIWREVALAASEKPVIVSMGDLAASGGYYIAAPATKIVAQPNTLTGSIGVFGVIPNMQQLFKEHLGITFDEVKTNRNSGVGNLMRPLSPFEMQLLQQHVDRFYDHFLERVAAGRGMTIQAVDSIAQGRVWSGTDALKIGLVDALGGLDEAVTLAALEAGLDDYLIIELPELTDPFTRLIRQMSGEVRMEQKFANRLGHNYSIYKMVRDMGEMEGVQARIPFVMNIH
jgi:protease IV